MKIECNLAIRKKSDCSGNLNWAIINHNNNYILALFEWECEARDVYKTLYADKHDILSIVEIQ